MPKFSSVGYITCFDCLEGRSSLCAKPPVKKFLAEVANFFGGDACEHTFGCRGAQFAVMRTIATFVAENFVITNHYWAKRLFASSLSRGCWTGRRFGNKLPNLFGGAIGGLPLISSMLSFSYVKKRVLERRHSMRLVKLKSAGSNKRFDFRQGRVV
ncbi:MAG: hypothetical protein AB1595_07580 [bacterium]